MACLGSAKYILSFNLYNRANYSRGRPNNTIHQSGCGVNRNGRPMSGCKLPNPGRQGSVELFDCLIGGGGGVD